MFRRLFNTWMVCGSGPSAAEYFDAARQCCLDHLGTGVAVNSSWQLWRTAIPRSNEWDLLPDLYFASDQVACWLNRRAIEYLRWRGVPIATLDRDAAFLALRGMQTADIKLLLEKEDAPAGGYISGAVMLRHAARSEGSRVVLMVGFDGYRSTPGNLVADTFDGRLGPPKGRAWTQSWYGEQLNRIIAEHPDTRFVICGQPNWAVAERRNVWVVESPGAIATQVMIGLGHKPPRVLSPPPKLHGPIPTLSEILSIPQPTEVKS